MDFLSTLAICLESFPYRTVYLFELMDDVCFLCEGSKIEKRINRSTKRMEFEMKRVLFMNVYICGLNQISLIINI